MDSLLKSEQDLPHAPSQPNLAPLMMPFNSIMSLRPENLLSSLPNEEQPEAEMQIITRRESVLNHDQILKLYEQQQQDLGDVGPTKRIKKAAQAPVVSMMPKQPALSKNMQAITLLLEEFKILYKPSFFDTELQKYRYESKEKIFMQCSHCLEELKDLPQQILTEDERSLLNRNKDDRFRYCKSLAAEIDFQCTKNLNSRHSKSKVSRPLKSRIDTFLSNLRNEHNLELRRKIVTRQMPPKTVVTCNENDFLTTQKREELLIKQRRLLAEFSTQGNPLLEAIREDTVSEENKLDFSVSMNGPQAQSSIQSVKEQKPKFLHIDESTISMLDELLKPQQVAKMRGVIGELLKEPLCSELTRHLISELGE